MFVRFDHINRDSNAELLRIICIFIILLHHICQKALYPEVMLLNVQGGSLDSHFLLFSYAFLYIGVNCFILISGWYGIKPKWRSFINLYLIYAFYVFLSSIRPIFVSLWHGDEFIMPSILTIAEHTFLPFSHGERWFMDCYIGLFLMSPLLNVAIANLEKKAFISILGLMFVANVYLGDFWNMFNINHEGYSMMQFIYLYMIGAFLRKIFTNERMAQNRIKYLREYVACGIIWGILTLFKVYEHDLPFSMSHWHPFSYNNVILMLMSIFFFLFMMSWHFQSRVVNFIAASTLSVYLLSEIVVKYGFISTFAHAYSPLVNVLFLIVIALLYYLAAVIIDQFRILITMPLLMIYDTYVDPKIQRITKKYL